MSTSTPIVVEKNIPIRSRKASYPWNAMQVGDSFALPLESERKLRSAAWSAGVRSGRMFSVRVTDDGCRVWRVK